MAISKTVTKQKFLWAGCPSCCPTNSVIAPKAASYYSEDYSEVTKNGNSMLLGRVWQELFIVI